MKDEQKISVKPESSRKEKKYRIEDLLPKEPIKQQEIDWGKPKGKEVW